MVFNSLKNKISEKNYSKLEIFILNNTDFNSKQISFFENIINDIITETENKPKENQKTFSWK